MGRYIIKRLLLIVPTLIGIVSINFLLVQLAPGGPVDQAIAQVTGLATSSTMAVSSGGALGPPADAGYSASSGLDPEIVKEIEKQFGFDKPPLERFLLMMKNYLRFDFGNSYFQDRPVVEIVLERLPVTISLGLWTILIVYIVSIPLGVRKALSDGQKFDIWSSGLIFFANAVPAFLFAIILLVGFAGGSYLNWFPMRGLSSEGADQLGFFSYTLDYLWHLVLPVTALTLGGFATLTMLTKNSFLEELSKQFVLTARAKGLAEARVLYGHVFRNAMLIVIAGFPGAFIAVLYTGSMLIEVIFSLEGMGLLGYDAIIKRDYPVLFATLYVFTLVGLLMQLIGDLIYVLVDPRIDFETR